MGFFGEGYSEIEKGLLDMYSQMFVSMGIPDGQKMAKDMLNRAIEKSKKEGTYYLPHNFGDIILRVEKAEQPNIEKVAEIFRRTLPSKKLEGVRDEDIRWWWNLNDVERHIMLSVDEFHRMALFIKELKGGISPEEVGKTVRKFHPIYTYGDPNIRPEKAPFKLKREDFPLPVELKDRVNIYIEERAKSDPEKYKRYIDSFSTFNALIRKEIKVGNI